jgi:hypothetical protein
MISRAFSIAAACLGLVALALVTLPVMGMFAMPRWVKSRRLFLTAK